jgi:hypothetical protein
MLAIPMVASILSMSFWRGAYVAVNESVLLHDDGLELEARIYQRNREIVLAVGWNYKQEMNRDVRSWGATIFD